MRQLLPLLLLALASFTLAKDKKAAPAVEETKFENLPSNLFYFEDSDVVLLTDGSTSYRSADAGTTWSPLKGVDKGQVMSVLKHPYDNHYAVALGFHKTHWVTKDQGESWTEFELPEPPTLSRPPVAFHASDPDRMLVLAAACLGFECKESVYYTTDGFKTSPKLLREDAVACLWAKTTTIFTTGDKDLDQDQILCIVRGKFSAFTSEFRLLSSSDFFKTEHEPSLSADDRPVSGIMNLASVKSYIVAAAKSEGTTELAMYVSADATHWSRAQFSGHKLEEDAYTLLESTNYSMQVDVLTTKPTSPMGVLLTSNSNGTFFRKNVEHTNRNMRGFVDFEKIQNIQGIVMVNTVSNWEEVEKKWLADKEIKTQISFDDGRTWQAMTVGKDGDKELHLHSVTDQRNSGRIFSSPAPGIVMGVGNTGKFLGSYDQGDTYVSDDAGLTWTRALRSPHLYEIGDQGAILVAIEDEETDTIKWSLNHGKDWSEAELKDLGVEGKIKPMALTTTPDSTSLKFLLTATKGKGSKLEHFVYALDFEGLHEKKCGKKDFEEWYARTDSKGEPTCIMGHTQMFRRRKAGAGCFVDDEFRDPEPIMEDCKCSELDFECDYEKNFLWDAEAKKCVAGEGGFKMPKGVCESGKGKYKGSSGYVLIPGNTCSRRGGVELDEEVERDCEEDLDGGKDGKDGKEGKASGKIATEVTRFKGERFLEYYYLERKDSNAGSDETVIMRTDRREAWISRDHGKVWRQVDTEGEEVVAIYPHQYLNDAVYLVTPTKTVYYSHNFGKTFSSFEAPEKPNQDRLQILQFHPTEKNWLIWTGGKGDQTIAHVSTKGGDDWETLLRSVRKCQFVYREDREGSDQLIYCEQFEDEDPDGKIVLLSSDDFFEHKKELKRDVINFATMAEYIVVALRDKDEQSLKVDTSIDGVSFADAQFPSNFKVPHQQAYTVLDSSTHAVFLHVTVNNREDSEYGSIVKSNSNGTSYVLSVGEVNRNAPGYVDFEKMLGLEGVAIVNRVANVKETDDGSKKKLKTYITHNDGADWALIPRPKDPANGEPYECKASNDGKCNLHLHGYTERKDPRDTFSSPSAVGLMIGTGNVGEFLGYKKDADTFATRDGGVTWTGVAPGTWMWEFGDQGSIIVIVKEGEATDMVLYSLDEGFSWLPYTFSDVGMVVEDITTVPSDTSRNFMLWGKIKGDLVSVNLDFSGLEERSKACSDPELDLGSEKSDYYLWEPKHPLSDDNCLFGHVSQYHRKKTDRQCYNGREIRHLHDVAQNCSCTRRDFECDYNYERQTDGSCSLVPGLSPPDPAAVCAKKEVVEYYDTTGYRRIPLTTCEGGQELDYTSRTRPCPGREEEYNKKHGIGGFGLFFAIVIPVAAAAAVGWWVWQNWEAKFGSIRLGDGFQAGAGGGYGAFDRDAPWIKYPVMALSGIVAVLAAIPMVVGSLWRTASTRFGRGGGGGAGYARPFTSRDSFQRGRGDYAIVDPDEGELLGEESDEEV
ncbi:vacuolar protein sorting/targeting protein PEP1 [Elasticomyces elasticus]|uniref:Vacuolar protein sorting/targeting protein 10 n=1 Tax=Elasticomyces elasticus TaxID=574655 RepID=A0AAN7ZZW5_9PEZI|nr:vacuolar protein sorting/targeting protein PEP1 [Elasticomyces elasticus]